MGTQLTTSGLADTISSGKATIKTKVVSQFREGKTDAVGIKEGPESSRSEDQKEMCY